MSPRLRPDFIQVRLSAAGLAFAGAHGVLTIHNAHMRYRFEGTAPVEVLRFAEWPVLLRECDVFGDCLFEEAPASPAEPLPAVAHTSPFPAPVHEEK